MTNLAIIGNGDRARRHLAAYKQIHDINVVAGAAPGATNNGIPWSTDYRDLLSRDDIDTVDIVAPPAQAAEIAVAAAKAGKNILVDYLPGSTTAEAEGVLAAVREAGVSLTQLRPERNAPLPRQYKATLDDGKLGSIRYAHSASIWSWPEADQTALRAWGSPSPTDDPGQFLLEYATGTLDLMTWFFGDNPVAKVFARDCSLGEAGSPSWFVSIVLFFADTSQAICEVGLTDGFADGTGIQRLTLTGMRGSVYFNDRHHDIIVGAKGTRPLIDDPVEGIARSLASWQASDSSGTDGDLGSSRIALAAAASLRTGQPVEVG